MLNPTEKAVTENYIKHELIRELKSQLADERRKKSFEVEETRKDNVALQKRIDMLENDLEEKCNHFQQISCQNEELSKEFADVEQNQRNEIISQGRLIDLLKGTFQMGWKYPAAVFRKYPLFLERFLMENIE